MTAPVLRVSNVEVAAPGAMRPLLTIADWVVRPGEHWAIVGGNGAGKTTLLDVVAGRRDSGGGVVEVLGEPHGAPGLRDPRLRIGSLQGEPPRFAGQLTGLEVVALREAGPAAVLGGPRRPEDGMRAHAVLELLEADHLRNRRYALCSQGEQQRIMLARALMREPGLLLLDEPVAPLDLPAREALLRTLEQLAARRPQLASLTVTHHLEELPTSTTHALLLRGGKVVVAGPACDVLDGPTLGACFGVPISVTRAGGRWLARLDREAA
jgi:iron complex transport system ATP-binding protein